MKKIKQMDKTYILNREDPNIMEHFKKMCQEKETLTLPRIKLTNQFLNVRDDIEHIEGEDEVTGIPSA